MKKDFPKIALGTWLMGGTKDPDPNNDDEADIQKILLAVKSGVKLIDTAEGYASGKCEELIAEALRRLTSQERNDVEISVKHGRQEITSKEQVARAIDGNLERLGLDFVDYYLFYAPSSENSLLELEYFFDVANSYVKNGKIRNLGVSNFSKQMLERAMRISEAPITVNQCSLNIINRLGIENGLLDFCNNNGVAYQAYRPIASILDDVMKNPFINSVADKYGVTPAQIAIAYLINKGSTITISASSAEHWAQIFAAEKIKLSNEDIIYLEDNIKSQPNPRPEYDSFLKMELED